jgi:hypothetical protein
MEFFEVGDYCSVWLPENKKNDNLGFVLAVQTERFNRKTVQKYLVAHAFDISWFYEIGEAIDRSDYCNLCRPDACSVSWKFLPPEWVKGDPLHYFNGAGPTYYWAYVGPEYWDFQ